MKRNQTISKSNNATDEEKSLTEKSVYVNVLKRAKENNIAIRTQAAFIERLKVYLNENHIEYIRIPAQNTVSNKFKQFNIGKNENGIYDIIRETHNIMSDYALSSPYTTISKTMPMSDMLMKRISVEIGMEHLVARWIYERFPKVFTIIPGYGSVVVLSRSEENMESLKKFVTKKMGYAIKSNTNI